MGLQAYLISLQKHGPEQLLESAQEDDSLSPEDRAQLERAILLKQRQVTFKNGKWESDPRKTIRCACGCGRRIPGDRIHKVGRPAKYFDDNCKQRDYRKRQRESREKKRQETFARYQQQRATRGAKAS